MDNPDPESARDTIPKIGTGAPQMNANGSKLSYTARIAYWSARHRWWVVGASLALVVVSMVIIIGLGTDTRDDDEAPGEAGKAQDLIEERFFSVPRPVDQPRHGPREQLVFLNPSLEVNDPVYISTVERVVQQLEALPEVASVVTFYDSNDPTMVSEDRHALRGLLEIEPRNAASKVDAILEAVAAANRETPGFEIGMVGELSVEEQAESIIEDDFGRVLIFSLAIGLVILLLAFRAVVAAVIPLVLAWEPSSAP